MQKFQVILKIALSYLIGAELVALIVGSIRYESHAHVGLTGNFLDLLIFAPLIPVLMAQEVMNGKLPRPNFSLELLLASCAIFFIGFSGAMFFLFRKRGVKSEHE